MRSTDFSAEAPGRLVPTIAQQLAFVPDALPPKIDLNAIAIPMAEAMQAIGELKGACRRLSNPYILISPLQRREALTSSAMEGTFTTADDLALAEVGIERDHDDSTREVRNYLRALNHSLGMLDELPICHRVITSAHEILLSGLSSARGAQKRPGEYKVDQNWIGGRLIENARFVPPPPQETQTCMNEVEAYINRELDNFPTPLMDLALVHYQLETIHPFADGNGRVGRMLISIMAVKSGLLDLPVLYVSPALEHDKDEYIDLLFAVSARGEWTAWLNFFFKKVVAACQDTVATIDRLIDLQDKYRQLASAAVRSASAISLVDSLFERPAVTVTGAAERLGVTYAAAKKTIDKLEELEILTEVKGIYPKTFIATGVMNAARPEVQEPNTR
ncbi:Fic family protein [Sphingomonas sp. MA1305]|uniref:Fic family protein n=1 Tax=Sphingomonas sp. MA1305 TaxID=2479204 RepID=UPI0018DF3106|nr:Fic family protein [Sphingomonas sp. MA1305]MBI0475380.1 Fic family protein [Sphingomonas sp. MA1305]